MVLLGTHGEVEDPGAGSEAGSDGHPMLSSLLSPGHMPEVSEASSAHSFLLPWSMPVCICPHVAPCSVRTSCSSSQCPAFALPANGIVLTCRTFIPPSAMPAPGMHAGGLCGAAGALRGLQRGAGRRA